MKHKTKLKLFFKSAKAFEKAYGESSVPFPSAEIAKAEKVTKREEVLAGLKALDAWNDGLPEPQKQLSDALKSFIAIL